MAGTRRPQYSALANRGFASGGARKDVDPSLSRDACDRCLVAALLLSNCMENQSFGSRDRAIVRGRAELSRKCQVGE